MRRSDREIKDFDEIIKVINKCDVCRLAINDGDYPYIVPMNFGLNIEDGKVVLYFHCASEGKKLELLKKMLMCGKVTHKNLIDSHSLFRIH